jgi:membrane fusion protein (multidrug efflux system)
VAEAVLPFGRIRVAGRPLLFGAVAVVALAATSYWFVALRGFERTDDAFVDGHVVFLSPRVGGHVVEVAVDENQHVEAGQLLVRLDPADFQARVARAQADLDAARNRMAEARASAEAAAAQVAAARVHLGYAERELARAESLFASGVSSRTALDAAQVARDAADQDLRAAQERERATRATLGNDAPVRQAEAALRTAQLDLDYAVLKAPFAGVIGKRSVEVGANVSPSQPLLALTADEGTWVTANFKETQIRTMRVGDPAEVQVDAYPGVVFRGHVESLSPATGATYALLPPDNATGNFTKVVQRLPVRIALDAPEGDRGALPPALASRPTPWLPVGLSVYVRVRVH